MNKYHIVLASVLFIGIVIGFTFTDKSFIAGVAEELPTVTPTLEPTDYPTPTDDYSPPVNIQHQVRNNTEVVVTQVPVQPTEALVNCSYRSMGGILLYDFGKVSEQKCKELSDDWWNKKQSDIKYENAKACMDTANSQAKSCDQECKEQACFDSCSKQFQDALAKCN